MPNAVCEPFQLHAASRSVHSLPPLPVASDALRNPELATVFCKGDVRNCDWLELKQHYSTTGAAAKEITFGCRAADSECYVQRYSDLLQGFCGGSLQGCDWLRIVEHWSTVGHTEVRVFSCAPPASDPSPPPPPPSPSPSPSPHLLSALSPPPPTDAAMPTKYTSFDVSTQGVKASVQAVAPTLLAAAATDEQETEIKVEVESRAAAAPSLPLPSPTTSRSKQRWRGSAWRSDRPESPWERLNIASRCSGVSLCSVSQPPCR